MFGITADLDDDAGDADDGDFRVERDNWETVQVFLACQTQWRKEVPGMGTQWVWHGLRYSECESVIRMMGLAKNTGKIFKGLRIMESAALRDLNRSKP